MKINIERNALVGLIIVLLMSWYSWGAELVQPPKEGELLPEITLHDVQFYKRKEVALENLKGKWVVLFFWSRHCSASLDHFEDLKAVQDTYQKDLEVFTIAGEGKEERTIDSVYRTTYGYTFPVTFDNALIEQFEIATFSYVVVVDPEGVIRTISMDLDVPGMQAIRKGVKPELLPTQTKAQKEATLHTYAMEEPFLVNGNGGGDTDFLQRSVLSQWMDTIRPSGQHVLKYDARKQEVFVSCVDKSRLYRLAYAPVGYMIPPEASYNDWWYQPVLEGVKDSVSFGWTYSKAPDLFVYSLMLPLEKAADVQHLQEIMQRDLQNYFGYEVRIEKRSMPYWRLTAAENSKDLLASDGGAIVNEGDAVVHYTMRNQPMSRLIRFLWAYHQSGPPFIDETGITGPIDITLDGIFMDIDELKKALAPYGLALEKGYKEMNVIVVSDPE